MRTRHLAFLLPIILLVAACSAPSTVPTSTPETNISPGRVVVNAAPTVVTSSGLVFDLSTSAEQPAAAEAFPIAPTQPLAAAETQAILNRLAALEPEAGDAQPFAFPPQSLPAPRPGTTIQEPFPPPTPVPEVAPETAAGPLEVLRYAPEGDVPLATQLNLTFNQPMVALTGLTDLAAQDVPVILSPLPEGQWRWVGTKTLVFEPAATMGYAAGRFPMATKYTVTVPAGTMSAIGGKLAAEVSFTFTTPSPRATTTYPTDGPTALDPLLFVAFDQRVDPAAVLETIRLRAGSEAGGQIGPNAARAVAIGPDGKTIPTATPTAAPTASGPAIPLRLATAEEVAADSQVKQMASQAQPGYWLAFRAVEPLPPDRWISVSIGPGTPSAEGPLTTSQAQTFSFRTYGPLKIVESRCGWDSQCSPFMPWMIRFSNPLDQASITEQTIRITPELPAATVNVYGEMLEIQGRSAGHTTYTVQLGADIRDIFGQTLGGDQSVSFAVGAAEPALYAGGGNLIVLDPAAQPAYSVYTINYEKLTVTAYAVTPDDWTAFKQYQQSFYQNEQLPTPPGKLVLSTTVPIEARTDALTETMIDLSKALPEKLGHLIVTVQGERGGLPALTGNRDPRAGIAYAWIQATKIGLDAFVDGEQMMAWANSLTDGAALTGVALQLWPGDRTGTTGADGVANLTLPAGRDAQLLVARSGADVAFLPANSYFWGEEGWRQRSRLDSLAWYVFDDRGLYQPGEEVHVKGWIRRLGAGPRGDVGPLAGAAERVIYRLQDSRGNQVLEGAADLNALGGFNFSFKLTDTMNLGDAYLQLEATGGTAAVESTGFGHRIAVQEFRRPEFEVKTTASEGPHFVGAGADLEVSATYYAGGGLANADVTWSVTSRSGTYSPPGWDDFTFGRWVPWWRYWSWEQKGVRVEEAQSFTGVTDAAGIHRLRIDFRSVDPPEPSAVTVEATVMDVNRQAWTGTTNLLVHPAALYVGLRTERLFVAREEPLPVDIIVTDLDGAAVAGITVEMSAARLAWKQKGGEWAEEEVATQPCTVVSAKEPVRCTFETPEGGTYRITATVNDAQGRSNRTEITRWVSGGERPPAREVEQEEATLIPDKKDYQPGDVAEILVQTPFYPAEGVLTLRRSGLVRSERFSMDGPSTTLRIPIEEGFIPNVHVQVDLVGAAERTGDAAVTGTGGIPGQAATSGTTEPAEALPLRPAYAMGELNLAVPPIVRTLTVSASPRDEKLEPGGSTTLDVAVSDAAGNPVVGAELAVVIVDEAILALTGYEIADPVAVFYTDRDAGVADHHNRASIMLANPEQLQTDQMANGLGGARSAMMPAATAAPAAAPEMFKAAEDASGQAEAAAIAVRTNFNPLAHWSPAVATDAEGRATVEVKLPDNLTRYRVTVVAVAGGKQFGTAASAITARLPLMVRPSPPRFLNFGDRFELPVVVQNQTDEPMTVDVAVATANATLTDGNGRRVSVPANDRVEMRFPTTTASAGIARFQVAATAGKWADAASFSLPVYTPATTEAFAVYGVLDDSAGAVAQPVIAPSGVFTEFGGLEITASSTALQALTDAVLYLVQYPFECSEQMASRVLAIVALRDVLTAFQAEGLPPASELEASIARDIKRLQGLQNSDGGFAIWRIGAESWPYHTVHVANALQRAKLKGYAVPPEMLEQAKNYLRNIESHYPSWYGEDAKRSITAYALNVRALMGDADPARARRMIDEVGLEKLSAEAIGWLLPVLSDDSASAAQVALIRRHLLNRVTETAGAAHFATSYADQGYVLLHSDRRADGILLDALIGDQPDSDLIPKLVTGLLAQRKAGKWANTQENSFILLALDRYFNTYEAQTPDFVARLWLGSQYAGEAAFRGRTTEYRQIVVPMSYLANPRGDAQAPGTSQDLILSKDGAGRLYYRLGLRYAPTDLNLPPYDAGFTVTRIYEAVDDATDVRQDPDGTWHIKAGARVRVRLTMVAPARRYHVALIDPLPAGLEALNPALATTGSLPPDASDEAATPRGYWWWGPWYEHQNLRDQRAEAFASLLWEGVHTYSYVARATTPGVFVVPPAKAEEMYAPETFGRSGVDRVIVE